MGSFLCSWERGEPGGDGESSTELVDRYGLRAGLHRLAIGPESPLIGRTLGDARLYSDYGVTVLKALRVPALSSLRESAQTKAHNLAHNHGTGRPRMIPLLFRLDLELERDDVLVVEGDRVDFARARYVISPSCVQINPGTLLSFTDADGTMTNAGSTDPSFPQPRDLPMGQPVTIFDGSSFEATDPSGWSLTVSVTEHWTGRFYNSSGHITAGSITEPIPLSGPDGLAWEIRYTIDGP